MTTPSQKEFIRAIGRINTSWRRANLIQDLIKREFVAGPWWTAKRPHTWNGWKLSALNRTARDHG